MFTSYEDLTSPLHDDLPILGQDYSFGGVNGVLAPGAAMLAYADPRTTWEKTTTYNGGLDMALLANRLNMTVDVYKKRTDRKSTRLNSSHVAISYEVLCM